jgi:hypothetical protein
MIWAVSLSRMEFIPHTLTPELNEMVFGVCLTSVTW